MGERVLERADEHAHARAADDRLSREVRSRVGCMRLVVLIVEWTEAYGSATCPGGAVVGAVNW